MALRTPIAAALAALLFASLPAQLSAAPDVPMCMADAPNASAAPIDLRPWRGPMCGPYFNAFAVAEPPPLRTRAIEAYRQASEQIVAANYEEARLQLDLAHRGLPRIGDRIALQIARLELLRNQPERAAEFFEEASQSPHESVRVEAEFGRVLALLRSNDPGADQALDELLSTYPSVPDATGLLFEQAQSLMRRSQDEEAMTVMHTVRIDFPGTRIAAWAESELARLKARGHDTPAMTDEEKVRRARLLVRTGPLDEAKATIRELLESPLSGTLHAEVHYLAGRLARDEGRWQAAESYLRTAQLFPIQDVATAQHIENRANDLAKTVGARDPERARVQIANLRAGRSDVSIPTNRLIDMIGVASAAGLQEEVDGLLISLSKRAAAPSALLFEAAMAAVGTGGEGLIIGLLNEIAKRPGSRYRTAAVYHLARAHERAQRPAQAALFFARAKAEANLAGDDYYALWAKNGLLRVEHGSATGCRRGAVESTRTDRSPPPANIQPRAREAARADRRAAPEQLPVDRARGGPSSTRRAGRRHGRVVRGLPELAGRARQARRAGRIELRGTCRRPIASNDRK